jgi:hypothetical protein
MSALALLGVGKLLAKEKSNLPVVMFDGEEMVNHLELLKDAKFEHIKNGTFERSVRVWVEKEDAITMNGVAHGYWGEMELKNRVYDYTSHDCFSSVNSMVGCAFLKATDKSQTIQTNRSFSYFSPSDHPAILDKVQKLNKLRLVSLCKQLTS